ncbi:MAG: ornithine carbamoyltransferase [Desulfobacteraceae bacterium 4484_190.1]|nr:MAG: ornithine carbamoyltransferase [Desulfobacteraceae bacterium 4484_190.1]
MKKDLLSIQDITKDEILALIDRGLEIKAEKRRTDMPLKGYTLGLLFEKPSTRTRVSFETAMFRLGGNTIFMNKQDTQLSKNETVKDTARVLSRFLDILVVRTFSQEMLEKMAKWADIPVVNALTDMYHPCQILSDAMTLKEKLGTLEGIKVAWVGDGNNVAHSWINLASRLGFRLVLACPPAYFPSKEVLMHAGKNVEVTTDPAEAVKDADAINVDVWTSMGQEKEREQRLKDFAGYQLNRSLVDMAKPDVIVMHCLPAHVGEEISEEVFEGPHSVVFDQAENKMHLHQALLEAMLL